jgi:hypothetical protein
LCAEDGSDGFVSEALVACPKLAADASRSTEKAQ